MFQNSADIMDFVFDPFDNHRLVVAHQEKPNILCFHPQASSLLASAGYDGQLLIWDLNERTITLEMDPLPQPLLAMSWSPDGRQLATIARDHVIRIYDPRNSTSPVNEGVGPEGGRGARIVWLDSTHLVITGFNKSD